MKKAMRIIVPVLLVLVIILGSAWYLFIYDRGFTRDVLLSSARFFEKNNRPAVSAWFYDQAYALAEDNDLVAIELAEKYIADDNYTQAEKTLKRAIKDDPTANLYAALCKTYLQQDKVLDAVELLSNIPDSEIAAQIEQMRPAAPTAFPNPGYYNQYISVEITGEGGTLYVHPHEQYPSLLTNKYTDPITLVSGENDIYAVVVSKDGLVSPLGVFGYIVGGVIEEVKFEDSAIEAKIRTILNVDESKVIYTDDLWDIEILELPNDVTSFADLKHLRFLKELRINGGPSGQMDFISNMPHLTDLRIQRVSISDEEMQLIGACTELTNLTLSDCMLTTTEGLKTLTKLQHIDLSNNAIRNLSGLSTMQNLVTANLHRNAINDLTALQTCTSLTTLDISYNTVTEITPISNLAFLTELNAASNSISNLVSFENLTNLKKLNLDSNGIGDLSPLLSNTGLEELHLSGNELSTISGIEALTDIALLNVSHNQLTQLPEFKKDCKLVTIDASYNKITSLKRLAGLENLNNVNMDYNETLDSVDVLKDCPVLLRVNVYGTAVKRSTELTTLGVTVNYDPTN